MIDKYFSYHMKNIKAHYKRTTAITPGSNRSGGPGERHFMPAPESAKPRKLFLNTSLSRSLRQAVE